MRPAGNKPPCAWFDCFLLGTHTERAGMKVQSRNKFLKDKQEAGEIAFKDKVWFGFLSNQ